MREGWPPSTKIAHMLPPIFFFCVEHMEIFKVPNDVKKKKKITSSVFFLNNKTAVPSLSLNSPEVRKVHPVLFFCVLATQKVSLSHTVL